MYSIYYQYSCIDGNRDDSTRFKRHDRQVLYDSCCGSLTSNSVSNSIPRHLEHRLDAIIGAEDAYNCDSDDRNNIEAVVLMMVMRGGDIKSVHKHSVQITRLGQICHGTAKVT